MEANPPPGMWAATGQNASKAPSLQDIRRGSFGTEGWNEDTQRKRAGSKTSQGSNDSPVDRRPGPQGRGSSNNALAPTTFPTLAEEDTRQVSEFTGQDKEIGTAVEPKHSNDTAERSVGNSSQPIHGASQYANGYMPPPKLPWTRSFAIGMKGFWKWFLTIPGFLITLYGLNVVAWGGMLFLLLCNAAPAMCKPDCNDLYSPRRIWIEIDSQILNALFCVTGFGLAPWRFRDLYWWGHWRLGGAARTHTGIRRLAGIHRGWFRLPGSEELPERADATNVDPNDASIPIPAKSIPDPPATGIRAPPTKSWKMDFVLWNNAANTFFQIILCFYMWHYNRFDRPSWATGLFVAIGCIVAGIAGIMMWHEGKAIKKVEGVPMKKDYEDQLADAENDPTQNIPLVSKSDQPAK